MVQSRSHRSAVIDSAPPSAYGGRARVAAAGVVVEWYDVRGIREQFPSARGGSGRWRLRPSSPR